MNNNNNNRRESSDNILALLLSQTPEQVKTYCDLLDKQERQALRVKVLKEMRRNVADVEHAKRLNEIAVVIENCYKDVEK
ncbi:MAG: hypothetical protein LBJ80_00570 [Rickettsiales bacterium]|jgi:hypothetical protein|nr:hypothetical protein [Rickettsiales bacterium]MDR1260905.1 hypothetical protein [Rickettsiales bacterium]